MKRVLFLLLAVSLSVMGCKKDPKKPAKAPTVATGSVSNITTTSFDCEGNVSADGGAAVTDRGVCYAMSSAPTISNDKVSGGSGTGSFKVSIGNLTPGKVYHARAYATNSAGTAYGQEVKVTLVKVVEEDLPSITLTTKKAVGEKIKLWIYAEPADQADVWIDLNNNKVKDAGESVTVFGSYQEYTLGSRTIAVYGKVTELYCDENSLTSLDVSKNTALTKLYCNSNSLTSLDVKNTALTELYCHSNSLTSLDVSKNTALTRLSCHSNSLTSLDVSKNTALTELYCSSNSITSLDVSKNKALTELYCYNNSLSSLDVSKNTALTELNCSSNSLTSLDVSKNTALTIFSCENNPNLSSLKISSSINDALWVNHCNLSTETLNEIFRTLPDVKGQSTGDKELYIKGNPGTAACNKKIATDKGWKLDVEDTPPAGYSMTMTTTKAVGEKIKLRIDAEPADRPNVWIDLNNNKVKDAGESVTVFGSYQEYTLGAQTVTVHGKVTRLYCDYISLTSLDVSKNTALRVLYCYFNSLTSLDVSKNTELEWLDCCRNSLTSLDVSKNTALIALSCSYNSLTSLDVGKNTALTRFDCYNNFLSSLDVSKNTALTDLDCSSNSLTSLDVSKNTALTIFECDNNPNLSSLKISSSINNALWVNGCKLSAETLNEIFRTLPDVKGQTEGKKELHIKGNPGTAACNKKIATDKGWTVSLKDY